jgi:hypothetical protein
LPKTIVLGLIGSFYCVDVEIFIFRSFLVKGIMSCPFIAGCEVNSIAELNLAITLKSVTEVEGFE